MRDFRRQYCSSIPIFQEKKSERHVLKLRVEEYEKQRFQPLNLLVPVATGATAGHPTGVEMIAEHGRRELI